MNVQIHVQNVFSTGYYSNKEITQPQATAHHTTRGIPRKQHFAVGNARSEEAWTSHHTHRRVYTSRSHYVTTWASMTICCGRFVAAELRSKQDFRTVSANQVSRPLLSIIKFEFGLSVYGDINGCLTTKCNMNIITYTRINICRNSLYRRDSYP
jgi:hypothetical protein